MKGELVSVEETEKSLKIWVHGVLVYNVHGLGYEAMLQIFHTHDLLAYLLQTEPQLFSEFIQQLRDMGLFNPEEDKEKPL